MSYMDHKAKFTYFDEIQELNVEEIENVNGGIAPLVVAAIVVVGVVVVGFAVGAVSGYYANSGGDSMRQPNVKLK